MINIEIENGWYDFLHTESLKEYFQRLDKFLEEEYNNKEIYPKSNDILRAFIETDFNDISVVIIAQDPYHTPNTANGLAFSCSSKKIPPSLKNIFKEIDSEYGYHNVENGDLTCWAKQGVFLLNTTLTVEKGKSLSHIGYGWEIFTDNVIKYIDNNKQDVIFVLWGKHAQSKLYIIKNNIILSAPHPSPFSARKGFFGCNHFKEINKILNKIGKKEVVW